jgi:hypothetical protein
VPTPKWEGLPLSNGDIGRPIISPDGTFVLYVSDKGSVTSPVYPQIMKKSLVDPSILPVVVSVTADGVTQSNHGEIYLDSISPDSTYMLFTSKATNMGVTNGSYQVIKKSLTNLATAPVVVSVATDGTTIGNGHSQNGSISPNGTFVLFSSLAVNLGVTGGTNTQILKKSLTNLATAPVVVSVTAAGVLGNGHSGYSMGNMAAISPDNTFAVFTSNAANLGVTGASGQVIQKSLANLAIAPKVVSVLADGTTQADGTQARPVISPDGTFVIFESAAANFGGGTLAHQIIKKSLANLATAPQRVTSLADGTTAMTSGYYTQISSDGSFVVFFGRLASEAYSQIIKKSLANLATAPVIVSLTPDGGSLASGVYSERISLNPAGTGVTYVSISAMGSIANSNRQLLYSVVP